MAAQRSATIHRTLWRWHFYAGLFVMPFILLLSITGAAYLFKPQIDRWEDRAFRALPAEPALSPSAQRGAALAAFPGASFHSYRLPENPGDAAMIHLRLPGGAMRDVYVSDGGTVLGSRDPGRRITTVLQHLHGQLLLGKPGAWLVELAASWAIVLILTGLYLWWPQDSAGRGWPGAGIIAPRLSRGRTVFWRDLHAVTGFWVSGLALVLLVTGLPWTGVWGSVFLEARTQLGLVTTKQDWTLAGVTVPEGDHSAHDHARMAGHSGHSAAHADLLDAVVARTRGEDLAFPVIVTPPGNRSPLWTARSDTQNRPLRVTIAYDPVTGKPVNRETFADKHVVERAVGYGIAWHEGQLLGWVNQAVGVLTAIMLITLAAAGFVQWRRRKPAQAIGAPPAPAPRDGWWLILGLVLVSLLLPLLAFSLLIALTLESILLHRAPGLARWLGLPGRSQDSSAK